MAKERERKRDTDKNRERGRAVERKLIHDEEFGEEDVELVDSEWADFERVLRYISFEKSECIKKYFL